MNQNPIKTITAIKVKKTVLTIISHLKMTIKSEICVESKVIKSKI